MLFLGLCMKSINLNAVNMHNVKGLVVGNMKERGDQPESSEWSSSPRGDEEKSQGALSDRDREVAKGELKR